MEVATEGQECVVCGSFATVTYKDYNGEEVPFCEDCQDAEHDCESCGETVEIDDGKFSSIYDDLYCGDCAPMLETCDSCDIVINTESDPHERNEDAIFCEDCLSESPSA